MTDQTDPPTAAIWQPRTVRGVPLHLVVPSATAVVGLVALAGGGLLAWIGGWILTLGFSVAVGAFVRSPWALAAPAAAWLLWIAISRAAGAGLPQTPIGVALLLAGLGAAAVWLGQRAILPAVAGEAPATQHRADIRAELDALLDAPIDRADSLALDPTAEVDEALAELLETEIVELEPQPVVEPESSPELGDTSDDDPTGHVIEFTALSDPDQRRD